MLKSIYERVRATSKARKRRQQDARRTRNYASQERWERDSEGFAQRRYTSYEEYLEHQASKLDRIYERRAEKDVTEFDEFLQLFSACEPLRTRGYRNVLCLGARLGAEVRALHQLGYFAVGVDLNPGPNNQRVMHGDFHALVFPDRCVDVVYTNCMDHVFDLNRIVGEVKRVLVPGGIFIMDVSPGSEDGDLPGEYEATFWPNAETLIARVLENGGLNRIWSKDLGRRHRNRWLQIVMERADQPPASK